ncbi:MAG: hypothetical protein V4655_04045 [Bdellovibrionota bacterium]|nr:MAG: hypothetical protein EOP10_33420 [Pseudomonadota bacterium]
MEGRVVLLNGDMVGVRLNDSSYSVFRMIDQLKQVPVEIGDSFIGSLSTTGPQLLLHCRTQQWVEVRIKLARSQIAAKTKRFIRSSTPRLAH